MEENKLGKSKNKLQKADLIIIFISGIPIILCSIFWDIFFLTAFIPSILIFCAMIIKRQEKIMKEKPKYKLVKIVGYKRRLTKPFTKVRPYLRKVKK